MNYLSVCSGIEAATQAWRPLGWNPVAFSEIEKFPSAVLAHHYPNVPNWGDMTKFKEWPDANVDVLVGGTPCQSFSVAGLRKGLDDPRGNLALTYLTIAERYRPQWLVWENVPGVLSSDGGRAFGAIIGGMVELGYCPAWRVLDAQYVRTRRFRRAVPQRRRRVFVVAHLGDWRRAAAVLFDRESLRGNPPPGREAGETITHDASSCIGASGRGFERSGETRGQDPVVAQPIAWTEELTASANVAGTVQRGGSGGRHDGVMVPEVATPVLSGAPNGGPGHGARSGHAKDGTLIPTAANPLTHRMHKGINTTCDERQTPIPVASPMAVRRLTPRECERLQGFPDDYTLIPAYAKGSKKKDREEVARWIMGPHPTNWTMEEALKWAGHPDGPRYKALGNSMAVNCMEWIGQRIALAEALS